MQFELNIANATNKCVVVSPSYIVSTLSRWTRYTWHESFKRCISRRETRLIMPRGCTVCSLATRPKTWKVTKSIYNKRNEIRRHIALSKCDSNSLESTNFFNFPSESHRLFSFYRIKIFCNYDN